ncbi:FAD-dependent oxidoreductase [Streptomyces massasporeus]|uniref:flavin monoamine oxidase family protein n=1 Tax=Streptomyces massasporeus TaxID=67324 RepID=UPI0033B35F05
MGSPRSGSSRERAEVVVAGAGLAGLCVAENLQRCGQDVLVVEAADRIGGRLERRRAAGLDLDAGGAYLGRRHTALRDLAARFGVPLRATDAPGAGLFDFGGRTVRTDGGQAPYSALALGTALDRVEELSARVRTELPGHSPGATKSDVLPVSEWAATEFAHPDARALISQIVRELLAAEPTDVSLLHFLFYARSGGGLPYLTAFRGGAQEFRVEGGTWALAQQVADSLVRPIRLGSKVTEVRHEDHGGLTVRAGGTDIDCGHVVLAAGPGPASAIDFVHQGGDRDAGPGPRTTNGPPRGRRVPDSVHHVPPSAAAAAAKFHAVYDRPFWRDDGLSGWVTADEGPLRFLVDDSTHRGGRGVLVGFLTGDEARAWHTGAVSGADLLERLGRWLGPEALSPRHVSVRDWTGSPLTQGCYAGVPAFGAWVRAAAECSVTAFDDRLWRVGSEYSTSFFGHMEGAVRSARSTSAALARVLRSHAPAAR